MQDPKPGNIEGRKLHTHEVSHEINWGYLILGFAILYAAWKVSRMYADAQDGENDEAEAEMPLQS